MKLPDGQSDDRMLTSVTLLGKAKDQFDQDAWSDFTSFYRKYIFNIVRKMGLERHDADDVVQMTLVKVWNAMPTFEYSPEKGRFRSWLCSIAGNTAKNFIRSKNHGSASLPLSGDGWDMESFEEFSVRPEVEELAEKEWQLYLPELALKKISGSFDKKTIQAFKLYRDGVTVPEIARHLGIAESSVYVYKQRVQTRLTREIEQLKKEF